MDKLVKRNLLLLSNSTLHGSGLLEWPAEYIKSFLSSKDVTKVLFVPYALHDMEKYTKKISNKFSTWDIEVEGIHSTDNPVNAVMNAQAIFIGGGNTFRLLKKLYDNNLIQPIRDRVLKEGIPYIGSSAGTNVSTVSINTTNDMPIVCPPSFNGLNLVPFNINPHYIDPDTSSKHMGESREDRINQYHEELNTPSVLGLREGSLLHVTLNTAVLKGNYPARLFVSGKDPVEYPVGSDLSFLL